MKHLAGYFYLKQIVFFWIASPCLFIYFYTYLFFFLRSWFLWTNKKLSDWMMHELKDVTAYSTCIFFSKRCASDWNYFIATYLVKKKSEVAPIWGHVCLMFKNSLTKVQNSFLATMAPPNDLCSTYLMENLHQDINRVSSLIRCLNGIFPLRKCSIKTLTH